MGREFGTLAFGVIGGFVGGLFTAGSFSSLGASVGVALGGALFGAAPAGSGARADFSFENSSRYGFFIPQFAGKVGNVGGNTIAVGKDKSGHDAGVIRVKGKKANKKGKGEQPDSAQFVAAILVGRSMGGTLESPDELFVDLIEMEDSGGRKTIYDRAGSDARARGYDLTQHVSSRTRRVISEISEGLALYTGTDEQLPDAVLSGYHGADLPAFRGCAYVRFNRLPIASAPTFYFTVRSGTTGRREIITRQLSDCGVPLARIDVSAIPAGALLQGKAIGAPQTVREICEKTARRVWCDGAFDGSKIKFQSRLNPARHALAFEETGAVAASSAGTGGSGAGNASEGRLHFKDRAQTDKCSLARVQFLDVNQGYDGAQPAIAPQPRAAHSNVLEYESGECDDLQGATNFAFGLRDEDWNADLLASGNVLGGRENWLPGDVLELALDRDGLLGTRDFLLLEQERLPSGILNWSAQSYAAHVYDQSQLLVGAQRPHQGVLIEDAAIFGASDCVALFDEAVDKPGLLLWVSQSRAKFWKSATMRVGDGGDGVAGDASKYARETVEERATCGTLLAPYSPRDDGEITLRAQFGELVSASAQNEIKNVLLFESGLVITFDAATLTAYDPQNETFDYTLSGVIAGRFGSDYRLGVSLVVGEKWVLLRDQNGEQTQGWRGVELPAKLIGQRIRASAVTGLGTPTNYHSERWLEFAGANVLPLSPVVEMAFIDENGDLRLSGRARTRYASDNGEANAARHRISEQRASAGYRFEVRLGASKTLTLWASDDRGSFDFVLPAAQIGNATSGAIAMSAQWGAGRETIFNF